MQITRHIVRNVLVIGLAFVVTHAWASSPATGPKAPSFQPAVWVNQTGPVSASAFEGRVVLVEKWATWCGPCVASISHLNELADRFGKQGLTIVGITQEPAATVKPFIERKGVKYMIGSGGADGYVTSGIPHAWLISPQGVVVWEGHPADLEAQQIQEQLKSVATTPRFELPRKMKDAENALNSGRFGTGLQLLKEHADDADNELSKVARETATKVVAYGKQRLQQAKDSAQRDAYEDAAKMLTDVIESFQGSEIAADARIQQAALREDPQTRAEREADELLTLANDLAAKDRVPQAVACLERIATSKKYETSKAARKARKILASAGRTAMP